MNFLETVYRWAHTPWDALARVTVALGMTLPISHLPIRPACWLMLAAVVVQVLFAGLVFLAVAKHK